MKSEEEGGPGWAESTVSREAGSRWNLSCEDRWMRPLEVRRGQETTASTKCHSYFVLKVSLTCGWWSVEPLYSEHFSPRRGSGCRGSTSPDAAFGILVCWASVAEDVQRADKLLALPRRAAPSVHGDGHGC